VTHDTREITQLLHRWREGQPGAEDELFRLVKPDLHRLARYLLRGERKGYSLQSGELVNEIYFKLVAAKDRDWRDRRHFFAISARAMRRFLIDRFRARPKTDFVHLDHTDLALPAKRSSPELALAIDGLLDELEKSSAELCTIVELKVFLGLNDEEASGVLRVPLRTLQRKWHDARRWLFERLEADNAARRKEKRRPRHEARGRDLGET
jgi:RNA polymerase sigma factor (TIGR02999 family)